MESAEYRAKVGPFRKFDIMAAHQFTVMTQHAGLRASHTLCDLGCGCLRGGKLFIPYLEVGCYFGVEPNGELLSAGIMHEATPGLVNMKAARFSERNDMRPGDEWPHVEFDFILAQSILTHCGHDMLPAFMEGVSDSMSAATQVWATWIEGDDWTGEERWYYPKRVTWTGETLRAAAASHGLAMKRLDGIEHPNGHTWVRFTLR